MMRALQFMWNGGNTRRFHTVPTLQIDTVGHHSFNVAAVILHIEPRATAALLRAALKHDVAEHIVGDMPAPAKRTLPDYNECHPPLTFREVFADMETTVARTAGVDLAEDLTQYEENLLKLADALDGLRFCVQEMQMGNCTPKMQEAYENFCSYAKALLKDTVFPLEAHEIYGHLTKHGSLCK